MVTPAGKEFLRNSINNAKFHNRIIEENEMWRQWDIEQGLTMMVSDDAIRKKSHHWCKYHEKKKQEKVERKKEKIRGKKHTVQASKGSSAGDRWDHSGFSELYPDEVVQNSLISNKKPSEYKRKDSSDTDSSFSSSDDDNEVWEEFKSFKRKKNSDSSDCKRVHSKLCDSESKKKHKKHCKRRRKEHKRKKCKRS